MHVHLALWIGRADQVDHPLVSIRLLVLCHLRARQCLPGVHLCQQPIWRVLWLRNHRHPLRPCHRERRSHHSHRGSWCGVPHAELVLMLGYDVEWEKNPWIRGDQCLVNVYYRLYSFFSAVQVAVNTMVSVRESINFLAFNYVWELWWSILMNQRSEKSRFGAALHHPAREGAPTLYLHRHIGGGFSSQQNRNWAYGYRSIMINICTCFISRG